MVSYVVVSDDKGGAVIYRGTFGECSEHLRTQTQGELRGPYRADNVQAKAPMSVPSPALIRVMRHRFER